MHTEEKTLYLKQRVENGWVSSRGLYTCQIYSCGTFSLSFIYFLEDLPCDFKGKFTWEMRDLVILDAQDNHFVEPQWWTTWLSRVVRKLSPTVR